MEKQALAGRYAVGERIGSGGMADVFAARDTRLERDVAVKIFRPGTADGLERGSAEARLLAGLDHPGLVRVLDMDSGEHSQEGAYLVMELVQGPDLRDMVRIGGPLGPEAVRALALDLARTLQYIHGRGIVHRDIKPSNILTRQADPESGLFRYLLTDFGIARFFDGTHMTATGQVIGSAAYFSPEQTRGDAVGQPSDIYSLGLVLIEALTGERAFPGTGVESALARLHRSPSIPHAAGPALSALLIAMTLDEPGHRPDAASLVRALTAMGPQRQEPLATTVLPVADPPTAAMTAAAATASTVATAGSALPHDDATSLAGAASGPVDDGATSVLDTRATERAHDVATSVLGADTHGPGNGRAHPTDGGTRTGDHPATALMAPVPSAPIRAERPWAPAPSGPTRTEGEDSPADRSGRSRDVTSKGGSATRRRGRSSWLVAVLAVAVLAAAVWVFVLLFGGDPAPAVEPLPAVPGETGQRLQELYESVQP
ncbi:serine/threonine-protein kinase [Arthrobacter sp. B0490]|uniref:serine/threonine-protein kinase n=1 Tax=Arthrobacter sp. B0490 TaxID=2058891 RepID=UPI000CE34433|nr:serine/threonine-protein kinase [Arthrobacter sp. B0490]